MITHSYIKRSVKTIGALMVTFIMIFSLLDLDTRSGYSDFTFIIEPSSQPYNNNQFGVNKGEIIRKNIRTHKYDFTNMTEDAFTLNPNQHEYHSTTEEKTYINSNDTLNSGVSVNLSTDNDNESLTLRFWNLMNNSSTRGTFTKGIFKETKQLPNLWESENVKLSRDDDRVLAQLIWAMEAATMSVTSGIGNKVKTIFLPESFQWWSKPNWTSPHILVDEDCPGNPRILKKCVFTENSNDSMDALITVRDGAHTKDFNVSSNVLRFYFMLESPIHSHATLKRSNDLIASFYRGSNVNTPYGKWVYYDPAVRFKDQEKDYAKGKTKMAAIFTSNCHPYNDRMNYVTELQKYIEVDVFGACGLKKCPRNSQNECYEMLKTDYHFYLSFENSNCRDYVTEKLFMNAFENNVIPIVLGAHPQDYQSMCPEKSYIHVEDYSSPEELAKYLNYLVATPKEYNSYFEWKGTGKFINTNFFCRVCAMVHYADIVPPPERKQDYIWNPEEAINNKICLPSGKWYWNS